MSSSGQRVNVGDPNLSFSAGKQLITLEAPGFEPRSVTVLLLPGPPQVVSGQLQPLPVEAPSRLRWSYVAAAGVIAGGTTLAILGATQPGLAVEVR